MQIVNVKMDYVELRGALEHMFERHDLVRKLIYAVLVETQ
jgi:hypothetical protein